MSPVTPWLFNEFQDFGWSDPEEVEAYEKKFGIDRALERERLLSLGVSPTHTLIDFGCGTGALALEAAKLCRRVIAVDVSEAMLKHLRERAERLNLRNLTCVRQGFLTYEHHGPPVEVVVTQHALHHLPDFWKVTALERIAAVLKPGGVLFVRDLMFPCLPGEADGAIRRLLEGHPLRALLEHDIREEYMTYTWLFEAMLERVGLEVKEASCVGQLYARYVCTKKPSGG